MLGCSPVNGPAMELYQRLPLAALLRDKSVQVGWAVGWLSGCQLELLGQLFCWSRGVLGQRRAQACAGKVVEWIVNDGQTWHPLL